MNPIQTNKPVFFGDDGEILKSGQVYIGQPNQWPLSFPKTVTLQDSAGSQFTAQQPMRTNGQGRISYNGKAVIALVDGDYSMLVQDRNGVVVADGYTPFVANTTAGGGSAEGVTQVGLLLSNIKQFEVTPGETVRNVGKATALDGLGADWLVVSNTGGVADDVDLIDFANGTQGRRVKNLVYRKDVGAGNGDIPEITYQEVVINSGDFSAFTLKCAKVGRQVTLWTDEAITHAASTSPNSANNVIPEPFRPASYRQATIHHVVDLINIQINAAGTQDFGLQYVDPRDLSGSPARTSSNIPIQITYGI